MRPEKWARIGLVSLLLVALVCILTLTDQRGRAEVRRAAATLTSTQHHLGDLRVQLGSTRAEQSIAASEVQGLANSISLVQTTLANTNASIASTEQGIEVAGVDISELDTCLGGVTQALDQVGVGETQGAITSLNAVAQSCNAAKPSTG